MANFASGTGYAAQAASRASGRASSMWGFDLGSVPGAFLTVPAAKRA